MLIGSESGLLYTYNFETFIIGLSSLNLMLPSIALYKLSVSDYGRTYPVQLEFLYKILHLVFVNGSYLGVRLYLWSYFHTDTSMFIIKNIYSILMFLREVPEDMKKLEALWRLRRFDKKNNPIETSSSTDDDKKRVRMEAMNILNNETAVDTRRKMKNKPLSLEETSFNKEHTPMDNGDGKGKKTDHTVVVDVEKDSRTS
jgi:hypothetical protein